MLSPALVRVWLQGQVYVCGSIRPHRVSISARRRPLTGGKPEHKAASGSLCRGGQHTLFGSGSVCVCVFVCPLHECVRAVGFVGFQACIRECVSLLVRARMDVGMHSCIHMCQVCVCACAAPFSPMCFFLDNRVTPALQRLPGPILIGWGRSGPILIGWGRRRVAAEHPQTLSVSDGSTERREDNQAPPLSAALWTAPQPRTTKPNTLHH